MIHEPGTNWTKEEIRDLLLSNNTMVERCIIKIYERQTEDEQQSNETNHQNGIGFNGVDATFMSSLAKQLINGQHLTPKQLCYARSKILKYAGQLAKIANGKL